MKHKLPLFALAASLCAGTITAQEHKHTKRCATHEYMQQQLANNPEWVEALDKLELETQNYVPGERAVIKIPVVFHVVFQNASENISSTRLTDQLAVLNADYRKTNTDISNVPTAWQGIAADMEIEFCLATIDPSGNPTTGINRVSTTVSSFTTDDDVKFTSQGGTNAWDKNKYLNIWVCDLSGGILGYAQFPGGPAATDGVVLNYRYTGTTGSSAPYNKGRTGTHEVGHWLNLKHIWGDDGSSCSGSDNVSDTPNQADENYTCHSPGTVITDACSTTSPGIMWMNYMDYTDDACMYMFTTGQKTRATAAMNGSRVNLKNNSWYGCGTLAVKEASFEQYVNVFPNPSSGELNIRIDLVHAGGTQVKLYDILGNCVQQASFDDINSDNLEMDLSALANGVYFVDIVKDGNKVTKKIVLSK